MVQAETERITQISDHIIHVFAFFTFSSSQPDMRYIIPLIIRAITAITATYWIKRPIKWEINSVAVWSSPPVHLHPGSQSHFISGAAEKTVENETSEKKIVKRKFFIGLSLIK